MKKKKALIIITIITSIIIVFLVFIFTFRMVDAWDGTYPGNTCRLIISKPTHHYFGTVTHGCSLDDNCSKTKRSNIYLPPYLATKIIKMAINNA